MKENFLPTTLMEAGKNKKAELTLGGGCGWLPSRVK